MAKSSRSRAAEAETPDDLIETAIADGSGNATTEDAIDAVTEARAEIVDDDTAEPQSGREDSSTIADAVVIDDEPQPRRAPRMTKADALAALERAQKEAGELKRRLEILEARTNTQAVDDLGTSIAMAIQVAGQFAAAKRGPHWLFPADEAKTIGDAYAVVAAPYAEKLKTAVPWALAIGVTWRALSVRLEKDKLLAPAEAAEVATPDAPPSA